MHAEGSALPHESIQQERGFLGDVVVLDEHLLEFVDDEHRSRQRLSSRLPVALQILDTMFPEQFTSSLEFLIDMLENAQAELAIRFHGDHPGMRQAASGVDLELDAFLEVDQIELDLLGGVPHGQIGDEHMQECRLAGARLACDQCMLGRSLG